MTSPDSAATASMVFILNALTTIDSIKLDWKKVAEVAGIKRSDNAGTKFGREMAKLGYTYNGRTGTLVKMAEETVAAAAMGATEDANDARPQKRKLAKAKATQQKKVKVEAEEESEKGVEAMTALEPGGPKRGEKHRPGA